ncbi:MAG: hypothetical protein K2O61_00195, partial [Bacteroidaceae bacterium]|nr:hypothetical protein [Bacteroidaceae bacterium]
YWLFCCPRSGQSESGAGHDVWLCLRLDRSILYIMYRSLLRHQVEERKAHEEAAMWTLNVADLGREVV